MGREGEGPRWPLHQELQEVRRQRRWQGSRGCRSAVVKRIIISQITKGLYSAGGAILFCFNLQRLFQIPFKSCNTSKTILMFF